MREGNNKDIKDMYPQYNNNNSKIKSRNRMDVITQEINSGDSMSDAEEMKAPIIRVKKKVDKQTDAQNQ